MSAAKPNGACLLGISCDDGDRVIDLRTVPPEVYSHWGDEDDPDPSAADCPHCLGTGIGSPHSGSSCRWCGGSGQERRDEDVG